MSFKKTGNSLDFALKEADLFFAVETPGGVRLTQQSSFVTDSEGNLMTKEGYKLLPENFVESNDRGVNIPKGSYLQLSDDGTLYMDSTKVEKLYIARVKKLDLLEKEGNTLFKMQNLEENLVQVNDQGSYVKQGFQQMSNVNAINEMMGLIETNRLVEMYQRVMTTQMDELNNDAITKLAPNRG